jgi:hypothetical protein
MASSSKRKTTMAKLNRERKLQERRLEKQAKKDARKREAADASGPPGDTLADSNPLSQPGQPLPKPGV